MALKRILLYGLVLMFSIVDVFAQGPPPANITATVVDSDGQAWIGGSWKITFVPNSSQPNLNIYNVNGMPIPPSILSQGGALDGSGSFTSSSMIGWGNDLITPVGSSYNIQVCPNATSKCGTINVVYNCGSVCGVLNVSSQLTASIPAPRFNPSAGAFGYNDTEAQLQVKDGSTYWNVITPCQKYFSTSLSVWQCVNPGGGPPATPFYSLQFNNAGSFGGSSNVAVDSATKSLVNMGSSVSAGPPAVDIRNFQFAGGAVIDGATPIDNSLVAATTQACTGTYGTGKILIPGNNGLGAFLQNGNLQQSNLTACSTANHMNYELQGILKLGSTLNIPSPSKWDCFGHMPGQFSYGQGHCQIQAPVDHGTLGTSVIAGSGQVFTPTFTAGAISDFIANSAAITVGETTTCNLTSTLVNGINLTATLSTQCRIPAGTKITIAGTTLTELNTTPILLQSDYVIGSMVWNPQTKTWKANTAFNLGDIVADNTSNCAAAPGTVGPNNHCLQIVTTAGTSGGSQPIWNGTAGGTTTDNTVTWTNYDQSTSTGGTVTGLNDDTYESVRITAVSGSNLTATFLHAHPSTALWGMVALSPKPLSFTDMTLNGIEVTGCWGMCIWFEHAADVRMDGVAALENQYLVSGALELASVFNWHISHSSFLPILNQQTFTSAAQTGYPCGLRLTMANTTTDGTSFGLVDSDSVVGGCIKRDANGRTSSGGGSIGSIAFSNILVEQPNEAGIITDPRGMTSSSAITPIYLSDLSLQDNALGYDPSIIHYTDLAPAASGPGQFIMDPMVGNPMGFERTVGKYFNGQLIISGQGGQSHPVFPWRSYTPLGTITDGVTLEAELRGEEANFAPTIIPYGTGNVTTNPSSWTSVGAGSSVLTGIEAPDGTATAGEIVTGSALSPTVTVYTLIGTTSTGDHLITGVWCMFGTNAQVNSGCQNTTLNTPYSIEDTGADQWDGTSSSSPSIIQYTIDWRSDWWKPIISDNKITSGSGISHTITMKLVGSQVTGQGMRFWQPFAIYIPISAKPSTMTTDQWDREIARWRQQILHGAIPPNATAGQLYSTHPINLPGNPTTSTQAANKAYVDANLSKPSPSYAPGDMMCAFGGDTTIHALTITGGSSTSSTITVTVAAVPNDFFVGVPVVVVNALPSGFNVTSTTIASTTSTTITYNSTNNPGAWSSGGTIGLACANATDAITATPYTFTNNYSVTGGSIAAGSTFNLNSQFSNYSPSASAAITLTLKYGSTVLYQNSSTVISLVASQTAVGGEMSWDIIAPSSSLLSTNLKTMNLFLASWSPFKNGTVQPVPVSTGSTNPLQLTASYTATGVASGTYTSGGSITGSLGQICNLTSFNNSSTATATVALTGTNVITGGTALTITSRGGAATAAPTSATLSSGTATCSGTATISTVLGGSPGNAMVLNAFTERP